MSKTKLKTCPFCGEELEVLDNGQYYAHKRNICIINHLCFRTDDLEGLLLWNQRIPMECIVERMEEELKLAEEEKERCIRENPLQFDSAKGYVNAISVAIEIVKEEGGV